jgi:hypothetical protein
MVVTDPRRILLLTAVEVPVSSTMYTRLVAPELFGCLRSPPIDTIVEAVVPVVKVMGFVDIFFSLRRT